MGCSFFTKYTNKLILSPQLMTSFIPEDPAIK